MTSCGMRISCHSHVVIVIVVVVVAAAAAAAVAAVDFVFLLCLPNKRYPLSSGP